MAGELFVVSGPSGVGKGTLLAQVLPRLDNIQLSISATTRAPRAGEIDGREYFFLTDAEFDELVRSDGLLEWAKVHTARYGTPKAPVLEALSQGLDEILEIDPQGALQVRSRYPQAHLIFIQPPSLEILAARLRLRGTESSEQMERRLAAVNQEMAQREHYDKVVVNDDLARAAAELYNYILQVRAQKK